MTSEKKLQVQHNEGSKKQSPIKLQSLPPYQIAQQQRLFIGISGLIGAGKSTLAKSLGEVLKFPVYYEPVFDHRYLEDFYSDKKRYGFPLQVYLLNKRFAQHQQIVWSENSGISDRTIYEDGVFAKLLFEDGMMEEREYATYCSLFSHMAKFMQVPNVIVHLDVTPEEAMERIKERGRKMELTIPMDYLQKLYKGYEEFIEDISRTIPVIRVNWSEFKTADEMAVLIKKTLKTMRNIVYIDFKDEKKDSE